VIVVRLVCLLPGKPCPASVNCYSRSRVPGSNQKNGRMTRQEKAQTKRRMGIGISQ
jgi:hypothetical protein